MNIFFIQDLMLVLAVSLDAFLAAFSFGSDKIKIPIFSACVISFICTAILTASILFSSVIGSVIPDRLCCALSAGILTVMGTVSLFQTMLKSALRKRQGESGFSFKIFNIDFVINVYLDETKADSDCSKNLSAKEAVTLALALSADSVASGFGVGLSNSNVFRIITASFLIGIAALGIGSFLGRKIAGDKPKLSWLSGIILIILGLLKYWSVN